MLSALRVENDSLDPHWTISFRISSMNFNFKLLCGNPLFHKSGWSLLKKSTDVEGCSVNLLPLRPIFPKLRYGRAFRRDYINVGLIFQWLQKCSNHGRACNVAEGTGLTRPLGLSLIDVDAACLVSNSADIRYIALSYVWGQGQTLETTKRNLGFLQRPGALSINNGNIAIPETIKDAMRLVARLNERYLWVDSLCIVQDDYETKQLHLNAMAGIYANAYLTIVAADGGDAGHGLRGVGNGSQPREISCCHVKFPSETMIPNHHRIADGANTVWASRGWTFQEALFSRRMLIFNGLISWVCSRSQWFEEIEPYNATEWDRDVGARRELFLTGPEVLRQEIISSVPNLHCWRKLVEKYRRRKLTYDSDVLDAFAGVTAALRQAFPGGFLYGLPEMFFDLALLWQPQIMTPTEKVETFKFRNSGFPSWSWAGWNSKIDDRIWGKCFNHIYFKTGVESNDCVEIEPMVKWYKKSSSTQQPRLISNSYHTFRSAKNSSGSLLLHDWSGDGVKCGYSYKYEADPKTLFRYPLPLTNDADSQDSDTYEPYLYFNTTRAWLTLGPPIERAKPITAVSLCSKSGEWVGALRLTSELELPVSPFEKVECEVISISKGKVTNKISLTMLEDHPFVKGYGGRIFEEWYLAQRAKDSEFYEFYNVLWIEWCDAVWLSIGSIMTNR
jgi:hypothetical protein